MTAVSPGEFRALAEFRYRIRAFLKFSERAAKAAGLEPQQHQLMLLVKAREPEGAGLGYLAERLLLRHHSAVGLVDRLESAGMVRRRRSPEDRRSATVHLTPRGEAVLAELSVHHRRELRTAIPALVASLNQIGSKHTTHKAASQQRTGKQAPHRQIVDRRSRP